MKYIDKKEFKKLGPTDKVLCYIYFRKEGVRYKDLTRILHMSTAGRTSAYTDSLIAQGLITKVLSLEGRSFYTFNFKSLPTKEARKARILSCIKET